MSLEGANADQYFALSKTTLNWTDLGNGNGSYEAFIVEPKPGLSAGTYEATLKVTGENTPAVSVGLKFIVESTAPGFVAVTNIKDVPASMTAGTPLTLTGTVEPSDATNQTITWSLESAGSAGAALTGNTLTATSAGQVTVKATVAGGATASTSFEKSFTITVNSASAGFVAVTNIKDVPASMMMGTPLTLTGTAEPSDATNQTIAWSVSDAGTTGGTVENGVLTATAPGTVKVKATIADGLAMGQDFEREFDITVIHFVPVETIKSAFPREASSKDTVLLGGTVMPSNATNQTIEWSLVSGQKVALIGSSLLGNDCSTQYVTVRATIVNGRAPGSDYVQDFEILFNTAPTDAVRVDGATDVIINAPGEQPGQDVISRLLGSHYKFLVSYDITGNIIDSNNGATISIPVPGATTSSKVEILHKDKDGWENLGGTAGNGVVSAVTKSFSPFAVVADLSTLGGGSTNGGGGGSTGGGSTGGGGSRLTAAPVVTQPRLVTKEEALAAYRKALAQAKDGVVTINLKGWFSELPLAVSQALAKQAAQDGVTAKLQISQVRDRVTVARLTLDPAKVTGKVLLSLSITSSEAKARTSFFQKWYGNKLFAIANGQTGVYGQTEAIPLPVEIVVKPDLTGFDVKKLVFHSYDKVKNSYARIAAPAHWVDQSGYLHFTTDAAGDIIVSDGELQRKP